MEKKISEIFKDIPHRIIGKDRTIKGLFYDSRKFIPHHAFVCLKGRNQDGHKFIKELYFKGCEVFIIQDERYCFDGPTFVFVEDTRKLMGKIARNFWGKQKADVIGITGTKGKSSTAKIISFSLTSSGKKCGVLGSLWWKLTTPEIIDTLSIINNSYFDYFAMEVTSISIAQGRVDDIDFSAGIFLGLGHDHLDFHGTLENYFLAKLRFLEMVKDLVIIYFDEWGEVAGKKLQGKKRVLSFSKNSLKNYILKKDKSFFELEWKGERFSFYSNFIGSFNWINFLSSYILLREFGFSPDEIKDFFEEVSPPPGRMEIVHSKPYVIVDYAHTPEALEASLKECRSFGDGKVFVVFGCGGDRDREKRPKMGKIAYENADFVIITSDNPRNENPEKIIEDILSGTPENKKVFVEPDRKKAIFKALELADQNDVILIAGKGHENYQIIGDKVIPFSDKEVVKEYFSHESTLPEKPNLKASQAEK